MSEQRPTVQGAVDVEKASRDISDFEIVVRPAIDDLRAAVNLVRRQPIVDLSYDGYNIARSAQATCHDPKLAFTAEILTYAEEDQGRDAVEEIMGTAARVGIEQGHRQVWQRFLGECEKDEVDLLDTLDMGSWMKKRYADYFEGKEPEPYEDLEDEAAKAKLLEKYASDIARNATYKPWPPIREEVPISELVEPIRITLNAAYELDDVSQETSQAIDSAIERVVLAGAEQGSAMCYKEIDETVALYVRATRSSLELKARLEEDTDAANQLADVKKIEAILVRL